MSIKHAILGFLSWRSLAGYDLKKMFGEAGFIYWAGTNNQIYSTLVELARQGLVSSEIQQPERGPARKVYTISETGRAELASWLTSAPEPPEVHDAFLLRLAWADQLDDTALDDLFAAYERELEMQALMAQELDRRGRLRPDRTPRERYLWDRIAQNRVEQFENELTWARETRNGLRLRR
ncbi:MAG TPA: PadR family transcriptional regulator [Anaerolineae bacterium]